MNSKQALKYSTASGQETTDTLFIGRQHTLRVMDQAVERMRHCVLMGGPGTGKTALLNQIAMRHQRRWVRQPKNTKILPVICDLRNVKNLSNFCSLLMENLIEALRDPRVSGGVLVEAESKFSGTDERVFRAFDESLVALWKSLEGRSAWCRYVLLLDNADILSHFEAAEWLTLFSDWLKKKHSWGPISIQCTGGRDFSERTKKGELASWLRVLPLGALPEHDIIELCHRVIPTLSSQLIAALSQSVGGHPAVTRLVLDVLEEQGVGIGIRGAVDLCAQELAEYFEKIWDYFDGGRGVTYRGAYAAPEHALMQYLVEHQAPCGLRQAEKALGIHKLKEHADFLVSAGVAKRLLIADEPGYEANFDLWNIWYSERVLV